MCIIDGPPKVYVETTIITYLVAIPSRDLTMRANQRATLEWWKTSRWAFRIFISPLVREEIASGDSQTALLGIECVGGIPIVESNITISAMAEDITRRCMLPQKAAREALHLAFTAFHRISCLLTWDCHYLNNEKVLPMAEAVVKEYGLFMPQFSTPEKLRVLS